MGVTKKTINKEWHQSHRMPKNPNLDERVKWHIEHAKHCGCREIPEKIKQAISEKKKSGTS